MSKLIKPVFYEDIQDMIGGLLKKRKKKKKITYAPSKYSKLGKIEPLPIIRRAVPVIPLVVPPLPPPRGLVEYFTKLVPGSRKPAKKVSSSKPATKAPRKRRRTKAEMFIERAREAEIKEAKKALKKAPKKEEAKEEELPFVLPDLLPVVSPKSPKGKVPPPPLDSPPAELRKRPVGRPPKVPPPPPSPDTKLKFLPTKESAAAAAFRELPTGFGKFKNQKRRKRK